MAVVFRQPFFLLFGLMGPLVALAQRAASRSRRAEEDADAAREADEVAMKNVESRLLATQAWVAAQCLRHPSVEEWLVNPLWRAEPVSASSEIRLGLGRGLLPREVSDTGSVDRVPVTVPLCSEVALVGDGPQATAVWRAIASHVFAAVASGSARDGRRIVEGAWEKDRDPPREIEVWDERGVKHGTFVCVPAVGDVPRETTWVVTCSSRGVLDVYERGTHRASVHTPDQVSFARSRWVRQRLVGSLDEVDEAPTASDDRSRGVLCAELVGGEATIDFVSSGPHALVWGKTGSGKSVLVRRVVFSLCARYSTDRFGFVAIDFKGGATLGSLSALPHARGLLTDLTPGATGRVAMSLRAEIRAREELFVRHAVSRIEDLPDAVWCPRTLIVIDEAGTLAHDAPDVMDVVADIATRGRSLGLHLLLSTQRPAHLPRDVVANCAIRWCLGVTDPEEAAQYLPDAPAHLVKKLTRVSPGTTLFIPPDHTPRLICPDSIGDGDIATLEETNYLPTTPMWCPDLPTRVTYPGSGEGWEEQPGAYLVGLADIPERQTQEWRVWDPVVDGPMIVCGESVSGHTTITRLVAQQASAKGARVVDGGSRVDVLCHRLAELQKNPSPDTAAILVVDRLDRILAGVSAETEAWVREILVSLSLELSTRGRGSGMVVTVAPGSPVTSALSRWSATWSLLRHRDLEAWIAHGGRRDQFDKSPPPGRGVIGGTLVQWVVSDASVRQEHPETTGIPDAPGGVPVVGADNDGAGGEGVWSVADAERSWQKLKACFLDGGIVFSGVGTHHMRSLIGPGYSYPPVVATSPYGWWVTTGGYSLVVLPR